MEGRDGGRGAGKRSQRPAKAKPRGPQGPSEDFSLNVTASHWALALTSFATLSKLLNCASFPNKMGITTVAVSEGGRAKRALGSEQMSAADMNTKAQLDAAGVGRSGHSFQTYPQCPPRPAG